MGYDDYNDDDSCDYYEDEVWTDEDWAGFLGCDKEEVDKSFDDQLC